MNAKIPGSLDYWVNDQGEVYQETKALKPPYEVTREHAPRFTLKNGYLVVNVKMDTGRWKTFTVHRLMLELFKGACPAEHEARFKDGVRTHVSLSNLDWAPVGSNRLGREHRPDAKTRKKYLKQLNKEQRAARAASRKRARLARLKKQLAELDDA